MSGPSTEHPTPMDLAEMRAAGHPAAQEADYSEEPLWDLDEEDCEHGRWNPDNDQCLDCGKHLDEARAPAIPGEPVYPLDPAEYLEKYTAGVWIDVRRVLIEHGFPAMDHPSDLARIQMGLFELLFQTD